MYVGLTILVINREEHCGLGDIASVRVLTTDKNLGPALLSTEWVEKETLRHLSDTKSYTKVTEDDWLFRRQKVLETRDKLVNS